MKRKNEDLYDLMEVMVETTLRMAEQDLEARQLFQECQEGHFSGHYIFHQCTAVIKNLIDIRLSVI